VLVVEDDPGLQALWVEAVEEIGCTAIGVGDGADACRSMTTFQPDVVVLDLVMPGAEMDGFDVLMRIGDAGVPIIVVSGLSDDIRLALRSRVAAVIQKPTEVYTLLEEIRRQLGSRRSS
jgi:CheY-like chemotaxis protein